MTRPTCPRCGAPVIPCTTPRGDEVLLDPRPVEGAYTLNRGEPGRAVAFPSDVLRMVHRCKKTTSARGS